MPTIETENRNAITKIMVQNVPKTLRFEYQGADGKVTRREVEPYEIKGDQLIGHCLEADATRRFKLAQMREIVEGSTFRPRYPMKIPL
jgi:predicted DNA-binding transcriptional regulator YafY